MKLMQSLTIWYQWTFPKPFRIEVDKMEPSSLTLASMIYELQDSLEDYKRCCLDKGDNKLTGFITQICNDYFRICRNVEQLKPTSATPLPPVRRLSNILRHIEGSFEDYQIECLDLTGHPIPTPSPVYVEVIGREADSRPSLTQPTIVQCDRPAVRIKGNWVQTARVIVAEP